MVPQSGQRGTQVGRAALCPLGGRIYCTLPSLSGVERNLVLGIVRQLGVATGGCGVVLGGVLLCLNVVEVWNRQSLGELVGVL